MLNFGLGAAPVKISRVSCVIQVSVPDVGSLNHFQESLSGPFINAKTQNLRQGSAPGPHAVRRSVRFARSAFMDSKYYSLLAAPIINLFRAWTLVLVLCSYSSYE